MNLTASDVRHLVCALLTCATLAVASPARAAKNADRTASPTHVDRDKPQKFGPVSRDEADAAIKACKAWAAANVKVEFETLETEHFLIFTNWDKREYAFLRENVENAYGAVSRQFDIPVTRNVFVGKLPIVMFAKKKQFEDFARDVDELDASKLAGYHTTNTASGFSHMAMWKPDVAKAEGDVHLAEKMWGYVLVHEFTHAFIARYRTDGRIPRWLNEGVAEVVASRQFPTRGVYAFVRRLFSNSKAFMGIFDDKDINQFGIPDYRISQTVVETLIAGNGKAFLKYFNDIKDGVDPDDALEREYHTDRAGLQEAWKRYLKTVNGD